MSDEEKNYKCTLLINYIRHNDWISNESMVLTLSYLVAHGATFDVTDSKGLSVMVYALKNNSEEQAQFLIDNRGTNKLNLNWKDPRGRSTMHYCVQPLNFGSYENNSLLKKLFNWGFKLNVTD